MPSFDKPLRCPPFDGLIVEFYVPSKIRPQTARYVLPKRLATTTSREYSWGPSIIGISCWLENGGSIGYLI